MTDRLSLAREPDNPHRTNTILYIPDTNFTILERRVGSKSGGSRSGTRVFGIQLGASKKSRGGEDRVAGGYRRSPRGHPGHVVGGGDHFGDVPIRIPDMSFRTHPTPRMYQSGIWSILPKTRNSQKNTISCTNAFFTIPTPDSGIPCPGCVRTSTTPTVPDTRIPAIFLVEKTGLRVQCFGVRFDPFSCDT